MTVPQKKSIKRWWFRILLALVFGILLFFVYLVLTIPQLPTDLSQLSLNAATAFYNEKGEVISSLGDRQMVPISQISPYFLKAIVAVEDARFYQHHGLSKRGLIRAFVKNVRHMRIVEGGSTITQHLAKNLFLSFEQTYGRKFQEMLLALHIERTFSKDQILEAYCNQICFGPGIYGIEIAAQNYLGKHADELNLAEAAFLTNLPRSPYYYNPYKNYELARKRQAIVLGRLVKTDQISPEEQQAALEIPLNLKRLNQNYGQANYAISAAQKIVAEKYSRDVVNYGGLKIHTTIDSRLQQLANMAVKNGMNALDIKLGLPPYEKATATERANYPQIALVSIEPKTGKIRALVGGRNYAASEFNRAISANRLPGSSFKPIVYLTALDQGIFHPASIIEDRPVTFGRGEGSWTPKNFSNRYHGSIILKKALMNSINIVAAKTIAEVGPNKVIETAQKLGITSDLNN
ncbi:transglycosylase domain-containing protein, partial [bacterium]|nr:transglycosylase domain-containing protein [bacterium]